MPAAVAYENEFAAPVSAQQIQHLKTYYKVFYTGNAVKKKEHYHDAKLASVIYYLDPGEPESQAASMLTSHYQVDYFEIRDKKTYGVYRIETAKMYNGNGVYDDYIESELYDALGKLICMKAESLFKGVQYTEVKKYFHDTVYQAEYECLYDSNGLLAALKGNIPPFVPENDYTIPAAELSLYSLEFVIQNLYYANADFLPSGQVS